MVGVTPSGSTRSPSSALMKLDLPELNSPATTSRNRPASWSRASRKRRRSSGVHVGAEALERGGQPLEQLLLAGPELLLPLRQDGAASQQSADHVDASVGDAYPDGIVIPPFDPVEVVGAACARQDVAGRANASSPIRNP